MAKKVFTSFTCKIFELHNSCSSSRRITADAGRAFSEDGMIREAQKVLDKIHQKYPDHVFAIVRVREDQFNFLWKEYRSIPKRATA